MRPLDPIGKFPDDLSKSSGFSTKIAQVASYCGHTDRVRAKRRIGNLVHDLYMDNPSGYAPGVCGYGMRALITNKGEMLVVPFWCTMGYGEYSPHWQDKEAFYHATTGL